MNHFRMGIRLTKSFRRSLARLRDRAELRRSIIPRLRPAHDCHVRAGAEEDAAGQAERRYGRRMTV